MIHRTASAMTAVIALLLAACDAPADGSGATVIDNNTNDEASDTEDASNASEPASEAEEDAALGTRTNPLPLGTAIEMGGWRVTVTDVTPDAAEQILAENPFNDEPADGRQFLLFAVEATYEGDDSGNPWLDFSWAIVGGRGNTYSTGSDDYCGVIPNPLSDQGETYPGGNIAGNVCVSVASDQISDATIRVEETFSFNDTRAFFAIE